jgi:hypothetical protein
MPLATQLNAVDGDRQAGGDGSPAYPYYRRNVVD